MLFDILASKRGDAYLRNLLVQGARSVLNTAGAHQDRMPRWALELKPRRGYYRTLVAGYSEAVRSSVVCAVAVAGMGKYL